MYPRGKIWLKDEFISCRLSHVMRCTPKWFYMSMSFTFTNETAQNLLPLCLPCVHPISSPLQPAKLCGGYITVISTPTAVTLFLRRKAFCTGTAYPEWENLAKRLGELHVFHNLERQGSKVGQLFRLPLMGAFLAEFSFRLVSTDCFLKSLLHLHHGDWRNVWLKVSHIAVVVTEQWRVRLFSIHQQSLHDAGELILVLGAFGQWQCGYWVWFPRRGCGRKKAFALGH